MMKRKGPIFTLAAGVLLAAVLMVLNINASGTGTPGDEYGATAASPTATATTAPAAAPTTPAATTKPPTAQVTYAGTVGGGGATLAIAITNGKAIAYVCDGKKAEAWLQGTAADGVITLAGAGNASLTGTYGNGKAQGTVSATGKSWSFSLGTVKAPSGLYRASAQVRGAKVVGGWIVLSDGTQVGVMTVAGAPAPAPKLDTTTGQVDVNGDAVTALPVDGTSLK